MAVGCVDTGEWRRKVRPSLVSEIWTLLWEKHRKYLRQ